MKMKEETVKKAVELMEKIESLKDDLTLINYTQVESVKIRKSQFTCLGIDGYVTIPKSLFRVIGKLIGGELQKELAILEDELDKL